MNRDDAQHSPGRWRSSGTPDSFEALTVRCGRPIVGARIVTARDQVSCGDCLEAMTRKEATMTFEVGQQLWYVPRQQGHHTRRSHAVTITKIGRKWLTLDNGSRVNCADLWVDGGNYGHPGRCYLSQASYEASQGRLDAWDRLWKAVYAQMKPPEGVTAVHIQEAMLLLGLIAEETRG